MPGSRPIPSFDQPTSNDECKVMAVMKQNVVDELVVQLLAELGDLRVSQGGMANHVELKLCLSWSQIERERAGGADVLGSCIGCRLVREMSAAVKGCSVHGSGIGFGGELDSLGLLVSPDLVFVPAHEESDMSPGASKAVSRVPDLTFGFVAKSLLCFAYGLVCADLAIDAEE